MSAGFNMAAKNIHESAKFTTIFDYLLNFVGMLQQGAAASIG